MRCPSCQHENPAGARFCNACGARSELICPGCESSNPVGSRFCNDCGQPLGNPVQAASTNRAPRDYTPKHLAERILRERDALEGERKQVTVLFADVKDSMDIAEQVDPEEWHRILDGFFRILTEAIHRFEGTVNQYTGDGVMALFGAPLAHEDHAQRACFAALHLRSALDEYADELRRQGYNFAVRMGLNSGDVVVGAIGDDLRMDYTAQGHTVGLAARVQNLAPPGRVCLTGETARLVDGFFRLRDLGPTKVKGVTEPVDLFELEDVSALRTQLDRSRARGFTRFVGRSEELEMLEHALDRADAGERQIVGVVGEAGIGKSRLCDEFVQRTHARGIPIYSAHCPPHGKSLSGVGSRELALSFFGVSEYDAPAEARRKIAGTLVLLDPSFQEVLPLVFDHCGVPDPERPAPAIDPAVRRQRTVAFLRELIRARSARECALFLLDDIHWADPETDLFISQIVETAASTRTMVLCNFRPEYQAGWMESSDYLRIPLRALTAADSARLVDSLLGADPSLADLRARILERAGGNPFFAEELVQSMRESSTLEGDRGAYRLCEDTGAIAVPETVHAVLAARIDRLAKGEKQLLQAAAVVGKEFSTSVLAAVVGRGESEISGDLSTLRAASFIVEQAVYPEIECAFKHPLTHEVAYRTQLASRRAALHGASAKALAERGADPVLIAQHLEEAGDALGAAQRFAEAAGEYAHRDPEPASRCWRKVRSLCAPLSDPEARGLHEQAISQILLTGWAVEIDSDEAAEIHREGMELARARRDVRAQVILLGIYSFIRLFHENAAAQVESLEEAALLVANSPDLPLYAMIQQRLGWAYLEAGDIDRCLQVSDAALARCGPDRAKAGHLAGYGSQLAMLGQRAYARGLQGHFSEADQELREAQRLGVEDGDQIPLILSSAYQATLATLVGDLDKAEAAARRCCEYADGLGSTFQIVPLLTLGHVLARQNGGEELLRVADTMHERLSTNLSFALLGGMPILFRALGLFHCGQVHEARAQLKLHPALEEVLSRYQVRGKSAPPEELHGWIQTIQTRCLILGAEGQADSEGLVSLCQDLIDSTGMLIFQPELDLARAELARVTGDEQTWRALLQGARQVFSTDGRPLRVAEIDAALSSSS